MRDQNLISKISNPKCEIPMNETFNIKIITEVKKVISRITQLFTVLATEKQERIQSKQISKMISRVN